MLRAASIRATFRVLVPVAFLALVPGARTACAQPCGPAATNVLAESTVCGPFTRISWTNPPGLVFPKVWRSADQNFANATLVYNPGLGGSTTYFDTAPSAGVNSYYWVGGDIIGCLGQPGVRQVPLTGPLPAGRFPLDNYPAVSATVTCAGVNLTWQPAWDVTEWRLVRIDTGDTDDRDTLGIFPRTVTSYSDADVLAGDRVLYAVFVSAACGPTGPANGTGYLRVGPWSSGAGQGAAANVGASATLSVVNPAARSEPVMTPAPTTLRWTRNGQPLSEGGKYTGTTTTALVINNVRLEDAGQYVLEAQNACLRSDFSAYLAVTQPCRADFNQSGGVGVQDIFDYVTAFFAGCP